MVSVPTRVASASLRLCLRHLAAQPLRREPLYGGRRHDVTADYLTAGTKQGTIDVRISYRIIELFSEGLYSSPHKAIEELVSNAFDAGAVTVQVMLPPDPTKADATIVVVDDGIGMNEAGLKQHWLIGVSNKRDAAFTPPRGRHQIGKFGIGKLATYVLAQKLTHVSKRDEKYLAVTMDYAKVPTEGHQGLAVKQPVSIAVRALSEDEAKTVLKPWTRAGKGYDKLKLFGKGAKKSWTVAIMSDLKDMAHEIQRGRLRWVLAHAMPLRDDFKLYFDGEEVLSAKLAQPKIKKWILGKDIEALPSPASDDGEATEDASEDNDSVHRHGLTFPGLGRVTGYVELFKDPIDAGKSEAVERSNGFFVYVRGRLVNADDPGFQIDRNKLRHGTFSRFRMVIHADGLDQELRSSRESLRVGTLFNIARNIAHAGFNLARNKLDEVEASEDPNSQASRRIDQSPAALTRRPLAAVVAASFAGSYTPRYIVHPTGLDAKKQAQFVDVLRGQPDATAENLVTGVALIDTMSQDQPLAVFDAGTGVLRVNMVHPFVAHFLDDFEHKSRSLPLELFAMSEVVLEAHLFQQGLSSKQIAAVLANRDLMLRHMARSTGKRTARLIAQALEDAANDEHKLEAELVACFDSMGFDAVPLGGKGRPDGRAEGVLSADSGGKPQTYAVSLEAKSKEKPGTKVSAATVKVSAIARHRKDFKCQHAVVVGQSFPTEQGEASALAKEIRNDRDNSKDGETITLIRVHDLARLVRLVPLKRVGLKKLRELFQDCSLPHEVTAWIDRLAASHTPSPPYKEVLEAIRHEQGTQSTEPVHVSALRVHLRDTKHITMSNHDIIEACKALAMWVPQWVTVIAEHVEITMRPDKILEAVRARIDEYPAGEASKADKPKG